MSTNINYQASTSRTEATARGIKRKREETQAEEVVSKPEDTKIKIAETLCSLTIGNESLKKQNDILKQKNEELSKKVEMRLAVLKNPTNILSLHDFILQRREQDKKQL